MKKSELEVKYRRKAKKEREVARELRKWARIGAPRGRR